MSRPLVTIISPTYNQERFVAGCAESALAQTYQQWEQIFVDDGSTDRTREILARFGDPRIRVISLPHAGLGALERSYNAALTTSRGSLVAILEGDDRWPADKLELQLPSFDRPDTVLSWGRADLIDDAGRRVGEVAAIRERGLRARMSTADAFHRLSRSNFLVPTVSVMVRRDALVATGGFRQTGSSLLVDLPTWLWVTAMRDGCVEFISHTLGEYRVHDAQTSQQKRAQMTREHFSVVQAVEAELGAAALARVGWTERGRRRAASRARLAEAELALEAGEYGSARSALLAVLRTRATAGDIALALTGLVSCAVRLDLVRAAFAARAWVHQRRARSASPSRN